MESLLAYPPYRKYVVPKTKSDEEEEDRISTLHSKAIATLPKQECKLGGILYNYQGFWYTEMTCKAAMFAQKHFKSLPTDILMASCPKSGTTWIKALIFSLVHRKTYLTTSQHPLLHYNPHDLVLGLEFQLYANGQICQFDADFPKPRLFSTHIPYTSLPQSIVDSGCRIVYIGRNLKDTFVSYWHFMNKFAVKRSKTAVSIEEGFEMYLKGIAPYGPHWDHALSYWKESIGGDNSERVLFLKYEQLLAEPTVQLRKLAAFVGVPFSEEEEMNGAVEEIVRLCSFENLTELEVNKTGSIPGHGFDNSSFFRKGKVNDSENHLTKEMIAQLDSITEQKLQGSGLMF